jgi:RNA polymerase sigma factor (sigma-70 family)
LTATKKISLSEEELVRALKSQETVAIKALYDMYSGALFGVISRIILQPEITEDILQETFIKIWKSADNYDSTNGLLLTCILNFACNFSIDKLLKNYFKHANKNQDIENNVDFIDAQKEVTFNADAIGLKDMVTSLKPEFNLVLDMVYFKGYTHVEAAEELDLPLGTVKTRIRMAIMELRKNFN